MANNIVTVQTTGLSTPGANTGPISLPQIITRMPESLKWAVQHMENDDDGAYLAQAIRDGNAIAVSDGSLCGKFGTSAFIMEGRTSVHHIRAVNIVPGPLPEGDSHQCELAGLYGIICLTQAICQRHNVLSGSVWVACDNKAAINVFDEEFIPLPKHANYDLLSAIYSLLSTSPLSWSGEHVKGHQDDHLLLRPLTRLENLNVAMDTLAKRFWYHMVNPLNDDLLPEALLHSIYGEGWQIWNGSKKLTRPTNTLLYTCIQGPQTQFFWRRTSLRVVLRRRKFTTTVLL
jgi:hypothetical protein